MKSKWVKRLLAAGVSLSMLVGAPASELVSLSALAAVEETALEEAGTDLEEQDLETSGSDEEEVKEDTEVKTEPEEVSETIEANTEATAEVNPKDSLSSHHPTLQAAYFLQIGSSHSSTSIRAFLAHPFPVSSPTYPPPPCARLARGFYSL